MTGMSRRERVKRLLAAVVLRLDREIEELAADELHAAPAGYDHDLYPSVPRNADGSPSDQDP